jgi:phage shock protein E
MSKDKLVFLTSALLLICLSACSAPGAPAEPTSASTRVPEPVHTPSSARLPLTEAEVPRISIEDAKAALESGEAVVVDVRSDAAYEVSRVAGAINIPLDEIEANPTALTLARDQWIITYCT